MLSLLLLFNEWQQEVMAGLKAASDARAVRAWKECQYTSRMSTWFGLVSVPVERVV